MRFRKLGFSRSVSDRALIMLAERVLSLDQLGTRPQVIVSTSLRDSNCERTWTSAVGATLWFAGKSTPKNSAP